MKRLFIATPLEAEHVERIRAVAPGRVQVVYEPDLLPPTRYPADHKGVADFTRAPADERRWREHFADADILFDIPPRHADGSHPVDLAQRVRWIQTTSSGVGPLLAELGLGKRDVIVTTARGVHARALTEFVFLALLVHVRGLPHLQREQAAHRWERYCGEGIAGRTLSIVGMGEVGRRVASVAKAFGMRVAALARPGSVAGAAALGVDTLYRPEALHEMLAVSDALVLSAPHTPETEGLIDRRALYALKRGAVLVNIARGQLVEEGALIDALRERQVGFAALDVVASEPLAPDSVLWDLDNVLISPHSASTVAGENALITDLLCFNLARFLDGRVGEMKNRFDFARGY